MLPSDQLDPRRSRLVADVDFEKDGKQSGLLRLFHSVHASAYGFIPIPIVVIRNGPGPTALFVSGNHGDEYEGQVAICNLRQFRQKRRAGRAAQKQQAYAERLVEPQQRGERNGTERHQDKIRQQR